MLGFVTPPDVSKSFKVPPRGREIGGTCWRPGTVLELIAATTARAKRGVRPTALRGGPPEPSGGRGSRGPLRRGPLRGSPNRTASPSQAHEKEQRSRSSAECSGQAKQKPAGGLPRLPRRTDARSRGEASPSHKWPSLRWRAAELGVRRAARRCCAPRRCRGSAGTRAPRPSHASRAVRTGIYRPSCPALPRSLQSWRPKASVGGRTFLLSRSAGPQAAHLAAGGEGERSIGLVAIALIARGRGVDGADRSDVGKRESRVVAQRPDVVRRAL
jgi:hypothetical protein